MKIKLLFPILIACVHVLFGCSNQQSDEFIIEGIHYFWYPTDPRTNSYISIKAREYFIIDKNGYCHGIIDRDSKELIINCMIDKSLLIKFMAAVNVIKKDTIIFGGGMDDPSIRKLVISKGNNKRRITFSMYESNEFTDFYTFVHTCLLSSNSILPQSEELITSKMVLIRSILRSPDQDGFYNYFLHRWPSIKVDTTLN